MRTAERLADLNENGSRSKIMLMSARARAAADDIGLPI
jgi:hypothetical protein